MPTVPRYAAPQVQSIGLPTPQFTGTTPEAMGAGIGRGVGAVAELFSQEQEKADDAIAYETYSKYSTATLESLHGDNGIRKRLGKDAVGVAEEWKGQNKKFAQEIAKDLTPRQKVRFDRLAQSLFSRSYDDVLKFEMKQIEAHQDEALTSYVGAKNNEAIAFIRAGDVSMAELAFEDGFAKFRESPRFKALSTEGRAMAEGKAYGELGLNVVKSLLADGNTAGAAAWLERTKDKMGQQYADEARAKLKPATDFAAGKAIAQEGWGMLQAGKPATEVEAFLTEKAESKDVYAAAQSIMRQFEQAAKAQDAQSRGGILEKFAQAPSRSTMNAILGSPEYLALGKEARGTVSEYMRHQVQAFEDRGRILADRAESKARAKWESNPEAFAKFMETMDSPEFATMTRQQIYAMAPEIGPQLTAKLLAEQKNANSATQRFQIDKDLLNEAIPAELLRPGNKTQLNAFRGVVESNLADWKAKNPGKVPSLEEQKAIARSANTEWIQYGRLWNSTVKQYEVTPEMRAVPKDFAEGLKARAKVRGINLSEQQILDAWTQQKGRR